jgi:hypothetical protein
MRTASRRRVSDSSALSHIAMRVQTMSVENSAMMIAVLAVVAAAVDVVWWVRRDPSGNQDTGVDLKWHGGGGAWTSGGR